MQFVIQQHFARPRPGVHNLRMWPSMKIDAAVHMIM